MGIYEFKWTQFSLEAEYDAYGMKRIIDDHNSEVARLTEENRMLQDAASTQQYNGKPVAFWATMAEAMQQQRDDYIGELEQVLAIERNELSCWHEVFGQDPQGAKADTERLRMELAEARAEIERLKTELKEIKQKTWCAYCGKEYPLDTVTAEQIGKHIFTCEKHPMREVEADADRLAGVANKLLLILLIKEEEISKFTKEVYPMRVSGIVLGDETNSAVIEAREALAAHEAAK